MDLQNKILYYLSENPDKSKTEIAEDLGYRHPGNVNKQINTLAEEQYVKVLSVFIKRGSTRERWSLSAKGIGFLFEESDYNVTRLLDIVELYREQEFVSILTRVMDMLNDMRVDRGLVIGSYLESYSTLFSGIKGAGTSFQLLVELIVRDLWEAPTYESLVTDNNLGDIRFFREEGDEYTEEQYREDVFDWVLRCHVDKISDFDVFALSCGDLFPRVLGDWDDIIKYGLDSWVKYVLENVMGYIHLSTVERVSGSMMRYSHQDFIEDLYSYIFGPTLFPSNRVSDDFLEDLEKYISSHSKVREFIVDRLRVLDEGDAQRKILRVEYSRRFLH